MLFRSIENDNDDEYDTGTAMNMDNDDGGDTTNITVKILHRVLMTNSIFRTVHELYRYLFTWYQSLRTTATTIVALTLPPPMRMIHDTVSELLSKTIIVIGQLYMCYDELTAGGTNYNNMTLDDGNNNVVMLTLWKEFKDILMSIDDSTTKKVSSITTTTIMHKNHHHHHSSENIDDTKVGLNDNQYDPTPLQIQLHESTTSSMVALLRSTSFRNSTSTASSVLLIDLIELLQHCNGRMVRRYREPIVIRDIICMIGLIVSDSSSSIIPDKDIELATLALLRASMALVDPGKSEQSLLSVLPITTTANEMNMIVAVSDVDDDNMSRSESVV